MIWTLEFGFCYFEFGIWILEFVFLYSFVAGLLKVRKAGSGKSLAGSSELIVDSYENRILILFFFAP